MGTMAVNDLLPGDSTVTVDSSPSVVNFDQAGDVLDVLSTDTAREILTALYDSPAPTSEVAERVDTSVQNAEYHLGNLEEAGLVEPSGTWYSAKGQEMDVYAPTSVPLVVFAGDPQRERAMAEAIDESTAEPTSGA